MKRSIIYTITFLVLLCSVAAGKVTYNLPFSGMSMYPILEPGYIKVQTVVGTNIKLGDIVCYTYNQNCFIDDKTKYICHQVYAKTDEHLYTKGVNNKHGDMCAVEYKYVAFRVIV